MAELLKNVAEEWNITKKHLVLVTDNASNMVVAAELGKFLHVKCYVHMLNLASQRAAQVAHCVKATRECETYYYSFSPQHHCKTPA